MDKYIERACKAFARRKTGYTPDPALCDWQDTGLSQLKIRLADADGKLADYWLDEDTNKMSISPFHHWTWRTFKQPWAANKA